MSAASAEDGIFQISTTSGGLAATQSNTITLQTNGSVYRSYANDTSTAYDTQSIMHYDGTLRGFLSTPIMTDKITGRSIGVNREMSPMDIEKLNKMYPCGY